MRYSGSGRKNQITSKIFTAVSYTHLDVYKRQIYSNASVLGGETVVGENTIIGGNTFITESVPANTKVSAKSPELVIKKSRSAVSKTDVWDWQD